MCFKQYYQNAFILKKSREKVIMGKINVDFPGLGLKSEA